MQDFYQILGVSKTATEAEIKSAYRKLAMQHHPDRGGDAAKFHQIGEAYEVLGNAQKRAQYDNPASAFGGQQFHWTTSGGAPPGFEDIFEHVFNAQGFHRQRPGNQNIRVRVNISLWESITGCNRVIRLRYGRSGEQEVSIDIPRGVMHGNTVKFSGLGDDLVADLPRGDLLVVIAVAHDEKFEVHGTNLAMKYEINAFEAMVGTKIHIDLVDGNAVEVTVPPGAQPRNIMRVAGHGGWDGMRNRRGDLLVVLEVSVPTDLTAEQETTIKGWLNQ